MRVFVYFWGFLALNFQIFSKTPHSSIKLAFKGGPLYARALNSRNEIKMHKLCHLFCLQNLQLTPRQVDAANFFPCHFSYLNATFWQRSLCQGISGKKSPNFKN